MGHLCGASLKNPCSVGLVPGWAAAAAITKAPAAEKKSQPAAPAKEAPAAAAKQAATGVRAAQPGIAPGIIVI